MGGWLVGGAHTQCTVYIHTVHSMYSVYNVQCGVHCTVVHSGAHCTIGVQLWTTFGSTFGLSFGVVYLRIHRGSGSRIWSIFSPFLVHFLTPIGVTGGGVQVVGGPVLGYTQKVENHIYILDTLCTEIRTTVHYCGRMCI